MIESLEWLSTHIKRKVNSACTPLTSRLPRWPGQCVACLAPVDNHGLCPDCRADLPVNHSHCHRCALPLAVAASMMTCGECLRAPPPFHRVIAPWRYQFPVNQLISRYKYQGQRALGQPLIQGLTAEVLGTLAREPERRPDLLVPSPMHPARQRRRGFNQAEDIAEHLSRTLAIPWSVTLLRRVTTSAPQSGLNRRERLANLRGCFRVCGTPPEKIALVDDVITTGATARTLAAQLIGAGAREVEVWALARTPS
ncbi:MAG: ComF family protein [Marinobacter sp.]|uniref:ComF family protein n=1 Tax=Marinobacter sp. TaxID=50741 RepID=UPI00299D6397|nr:ComF family protein [Marinobacter sp.]MDX1635370.1 ComF family protein [Marinobacter sp.]